LKVFDPDQRCVPGRSPSRSIWYRFDQGVGTTYSLEPASLLAVPFHLARIAQDGNNDVLKDPVALLEALRRVSDRLTLFAEAGRIHAPSESNVLFGLLEDLIVQARAPNKGAFHAKLWVLRFASVREEDPPLIRLILPTRNLTSDRSWDLTLVLDGQPRGRNVAANRELAQLIAELPKFAMRRLTPARAKSIRQLAQEVRRSRWELPDGYESVSFHTPGLEWEQWLPDNSDQLLVISPFLSSQALTRLEESTDRAVALVSRTEELDCISPEVLDRFQSVYVLHDAAEAEDGEDTEDGLRGLHAKAYAIKKGWKSHIYVGSANATSSALLLGRNIEIIAELVASRKAVGKPEDLLVTEGFRDLLTEYVPTDEPSDEDPDEAAAELALEDARRSLAAANLTLSCLEQPEGWRLELEAPGPVELPGIKSIYWGPISIAQDRWVDGKGLLLGVPSRSPSVATCNVTGLAGFELTAEALTKRVCFVLNLPLRNPPDDRDAEVLRTVIRNRDGFLRYLLMLLEEDSEEGEPALNPWRHQDGNGFTLNFDDGRPLLEELVRALQRSPASLHAVKRLLDSLLASPHGSDLVPPDFLEVWQVFEQVLTGEGGA